MSRFNTPTLVRVPIQGDSVNLAGGEAFSVTPEYELAAIALTSFVKDQFYRSKDEVLARIRELIVKVSPEYAARVALYARREAGMRSISHVIAGELAGVRMAGARAFYRDIVRRPDDMFEIMAYTKLRLNKGRKSKTHAMVAGFRAAIEKMGPYQLAKYQGQPGAIRMVDMVNLCHPKPSETNREALSLLVKGELKEQDTWESRLSVLGADKAKVWGDLLSEGKLGYFATLRNLRNIAEQAPEQVTNACAVLTDPERARKSLVLPFRAATAYREIAKTQVAARQEIMRALSKAADLLMSSVPEFTGRMLVVLDCSGSMRGAQGYKPVMDFASVFAATLYKRNALNADLMLFGADAVYSSLDADTPLLSIADKVAEHDGGGTDFKPIFTRAKGKYARVVILSDMQGWMAFTGPTGAYEDYCRREGCRPKVFSFDLAGYGALQFPQQDVFCLAGYSDRALALIPLLEQDKGALVNVVKAYKVGRDESEEAA